jgi:hypothetical protein
MNRLPAVWLTIASAFGCCILLFASASLTTAQEQESRMRSILEPAQDTAFRLHNKAFYGLREVNAKIAKVKSFRFDNRTVTKSYFTVRKATKSFFASGKRAATKVLLLSPDEAPEASQTINLPTVEVKTSEEASQTFETNALADRDRSVPRGSGPFELPLPADNPNRQTSGDGQLTIDQVREILNKTR